MYLYESILYTFMRNHWKTPPPLIQEELLRTYNVEQERFASPLNLNPAIPEYWSAFPEDTLFGAHPDAYSSRMTACGYMNPEYEEDELEKALQWAVWASETDEPVCFLAVYPKWIKAITMSTWLPDSSGAHSPSSPRTTGRHHGEAGPGRVRTAKLAGDGHRDL
jgi:hypothetical protein